MADNNLDMECTPIYPAKRRTSGKYKGTFAHLTVKDRIVLVLTQVVDTMSKKINDIPAAEPLSSSSSEQQQDREARQEDLKLVVGQLSELRYSIQTDKPLPTLAQGEDLRLWAEVVEVYKKKNGQAPSWFSASWLFVECLMYRKIFDVLKTSTYFVAVDPFSQQKAQSFSAYQKQATSLAKLVAMVTTGQALGREEARHRFRHLLLISLWGNKTDLSMMATQGDYNASQDEAAHDAEVEQEVKRLLGNVLCDHSNRAYQVLEPRSSSRVDFVLDNVGFELFTDLCFAEFLVHSGFTSTVVFHCKQMPWFVSDASVADFMWLLDQMCCHDNPNMKALGAKWRGRVNEGSWKVVDHFFWTCPHEFAQMSRVAPDLYQDLGKSSLVFFKGDLNYRKLVADRNWPYTTSFSECLEGFSPTNVCTLRTLKADIIGGLPPGAAKMAAKQNDKWLISGQFGVVQFS